MMRKNILLLTTIMLLNITGLFAQDESDTTVYLITCGPGTETYSIYGHSALRISISSTGSDEIYNWGVFDFSTPNFAWNFAKGRLEYMLRAESPDRFLQGYFYEQRFVYSQKINLTPDEKITLLALINENLKPENVRYRYDFFYDDCSTRIRDLLEKAIGAKLLYPPVEVRDEPTFREMVGKYQDPFPWLKFGVDLIMGSSGDKETTFRDRMFLPIDMQNALVDARINREGKMIPLLHNPEVLLDFPSPTPPPYLFTAPVFIFTLLLILVIIMSAAFRTMKANKIIDISIYSIFSILAILMVFFNFFTDHQQMKWNLNILWLNPVIIFCLAMLILNKSGILLFRSLFVISCIFLIISFILPQDFNIAIYPLVFILIIRSSVRADYDWNPLSMKG